MYSKFINNIIAKGGTYDPVRSVVTLNGFSITVVSGCNNHCDCEKKGKKCNNEEKCKTSKKKRF